MSSSGEGGKGDWSLRGTNGRYFGCEREWMARVDEL